MFRLSSPHADENGFAFQLHDTFGTTSTAFANRQIFEIARVVGQRDGDLDLQAINTVVALVDGLRPENELEAAVAVQIGLTHQLSVEMLRHVVNAHCLEHRERYANLATKLQRTMTTQIDTLTKLRRGSEPKIGQVNVNEGGQAIVGSVTSVRSADESGG